MSHYFLTMSYSAGNATRIRYKSFTNYSNTTTGASSSRTIPSGTVNNDIVLVFYVKENNSDVLITSGYTQIARTTVFNTTLNTYRDAFIFKKDVVITSDSGKTVTITPSTQSPASICIMTLSTSTGLCNIANNLTVEKIEQVSNTIEPAHVTATRKGDFVVFFATSCVNATSSTSSFSPPTGTTELLSAHTTKRLNIAYKQLNELETTSGTYKTNLTATQNSQACITLLLSAV